MRTRIVLVSAALLAGVVAALALPARKGCWRAGKQRPRDTAAYKDAGGNGVNESDLALIKAPSDITATPLVNGAG